MHAEILAFCLLARPPACLPMYMCPATGIYITVWVCSYRCCVLSSSRVRWSREVYLYTVFLIDNTVRSVSVSMHTFFLAIIVTILVAFVLSLLCIIIWMWLVAHAVSFIPLLFRFFSVLIRFRTPFVAWHIIIYIKVKIEHRIHRELICTQTKRLCCIHYFTILHWVGSDRIRYVIHRHTQTCTHTCASVYRRKGPRTLTTMYKHLIFAIDHITFGWARIYIICVTWPLVRSFVALWTRQSHRIPQHTVHRSLATKNRWVFAFCCYAVAVSLYFILFIVLSFVSFGVC